MTGAAAVAALLTSLWCRMQSTQSQYPLPLLYILATSYLLAFCHIPMPLQHMQHWWPWPYNTGVCPTCLVQRQASFVALPDLIDQPFSLSQSDSIHASCFSSRPVSCKQQQLPAHQNKLGLIFQHASGPPKLPYNIQHVCLSYVGHWISAADLSTCSSPEATDQVDRGAAGTHAQVQSYLSIEYDCSQLTGSHVSIV